MNIGHSMLGSYISRAETATFVGKRFNAIETEIEGKDRHVQLKFLGNDGATASWSVQDLVDKNDGFLESLDHYVGQPLQDFYTKVLKWKCCQIRLFLWGKKVHFT